MNKRDIYFSHDGSIDDFIALLALTQMQDVHILGIGLINADCYADVGEKVTRKILDRFCGYEVETALSTARPVNQFPDVWRRFAYSLDALLILNESGKIVAPLTEEPAHLHMTRKIRENPGKTTIFAVGPLTDVASALRAEPEMVEKIERLIWMGGSFAETGNVDEPNHDGSAEWNSFWDPFAIKEVFTYDIPITMVPLHATNQCRWRKELGDRWARLRMYPAIDFAGQCYSIVSQLYEYYFWDALAAAWFGNADIATTRELRCDIQCTGISAGRIEETTDGRLVTILDQVDHEKTFDSLTELFKIPGKYQKQPEM